MLARMMGSALSDLIFEAIMQSAQARIDRNQVDL
jgi:hypothetical protein